MADRVLMICWNSPVRGREEPIAIFEPWPDDAPPAWREAYLLAYAMIERDAGRAAILLQKLTAERPADLAMRWAAAWEKDPRQIEVVLRESKRIVRMANGVLISETHHGFVCANAAVDASNVAPRASLMATSATSSTFSGRISMVSSPPSIRETSSTSLITVSSRVPLLWMSPA